MPIANKKRLYIINNYSLDYPTDRISRIISIIQDNARNLEVKIVHSSQIDVDILKKSAGLIISGSNVNVSEFYNNRKLEEKFKIEIKLIQKANQKPILAICYGHQLTAYAFNGKVKRMNISGEDGKIISISLKKPDEIIPYKDIPIEINHLDFVSPNDATIQKHFDVIATSERNGYKMIQYMRHFKRPIFSVQFHPETHQLDYRYINTKDENLINKTRQIGEEIINNFISFLESN